MGAIDCPCGHLEATEDDELQRSTSRTTTRRSSGLTRRSDSESPPTRTTPSGTPLLAGLDLPAPRRGRNRSLAAWLLGLSPGDCGDRVTAQEREPATLCGFTHHSVGDYDRD
jgi:hypothetical protein